METGLDWFSRYGDAAFFLLLMFGILGLPLRAETLLTFAGYLCFKGKFVFVGTLATVFFGGVLGITLGYVVGEKWKHLSQQLQLVLFIGAIMVILGLAVASLVISRSAKPD